MGNYLLNLVGSIGQKVQSRYMKHKFLKSQLRKLLSVFISLSMISQTAILPTGSASAQMIAPLPVPGSLTPLSPAYHPPLMMGLKIDVNNPFNIEFLMDQGQDALAEDTQREEFTKLIKYFLSSLTIAEDHMWVNLSPYEKDRVIEDDLGQTQMGMDLLAQDYLLKQITSSLMYPENETGSQFWERIRERIRSEYGTEAVPVNVLNKVWIVPEEAVVFEEGDTAWVYHVHLKVMLEEDYLAQQKSDQWSVISDQSKNTTTDHRTQTTQIIREIILPAIETEINEGKNFAVLRQIVNAMVLATWYKMNLKESILTQNYADKSKLKGIEVKEGASREDIYQQYIDAFKAGAYEYIKEEYNPITQEVVARKYFSGGFEDNLSKTLITAEHIFEIPSNIRSKGAQDVQRAVDQGILSVQSKFNFTEDADNASLTEEATKELDRLIGSEAVVQLGLINELGAGQQYVDNFTKNVEASLTGNLKEDLDNLQKAGDVLVGLKNKAFTQPIEKMEKIIKEKQRSIKKQAKSAALQTEPDTINNQSNERSEVVLKKKARVKHTFKHNDKVNYSSFSPDGKYIVTASDDQTAKVWDAETGGELLTFEEHNDSVWSAAFSPDGRYIVTASRNKTAKVWDAETGKELLTLKGHSSSVLSAAFSPDGRYIVTASIDKTAKVWGAETGKELLTLKGHSNLVLSAIFSPDGRRIVTAGYDKTAKVWDAETGKELLTLEEHNDSVWSAAFSPDGRYIVTASSDKTAKVWDAETGKELLTLKGHSSSVLSAAFSPDGRYIVTASIDTTAKVWGAETGKEVLTLKEHGDSVLSAVFSPDGRRIVTAGYDRTAKVWEVGVLKRIVGQQKGKLKERIDAASLTAKVIEKLDRLIGSEAVVQLGLINELGANQQYVDNFAKNVEASLTGNLKEDLDNLQKAGDVLVGLKNKAFDGPVEFLEEKAEDLKEQIAQQPEENIGSTSRSSQSHTQKKAVLGKFYQLDATELGAQLARMFSRLHGKGWIDGITRIEVNGEERWLSFGQYGKAFEIRMNDKGEYEKVDDGLAAMVRRLHGRSWIRGITRIEVNGEERWLSFGSDGNAFEIRMNDKGEYEKVNDGLAAMVSRLHGKGWIDGITRVEIEGEEQWLSFGSDGNAFEIRMNDKGEYEKVNDGLAAMVSRLHGESWIRGITRIEVNGEERWLSFGRYGKAFEIRMNDKGKYEEVNDGLAAMVRRLHGRSWIRGITRIEVNGEELWLSFGDSGKAFAFKQEAREDADAASLTAEDIEKLAGVFTDKQIEQLALIAEGLGADKARKLLKQDFIQQDIETLNNYVPVLKQISFDFPELIVLIEELLKDPQKIQDASSETGGREALEKKRAVSAYQRQLDQLNIELKALQKKIDDQSQTPFQFKEVEEVDGDDKFKKLADMIAADFRFRFKSPVSGRIKGQWIDNQENHFFVYSQGTKSRPLGGVPSNATNMEYVYDGENWIGFHSTSITKETVKSQNTWTNRWRANTPKVQLTEKNFLQTDIIPVSDGSDNHFISKGTDWRRVDVSLSTEVFNDYVRSWNEYEGGLMAQVYERLKQVYPGTPEIKAVAPVQVGSGVVHYFIISSMRGRDSQALEYTWQNGQWVEIEDSLVTARLNEEYINQSTQSTSYTIEIQSIALDGKYYVLLEDFKKVYGGFVFDGGQWIETSPNETSFVEKKITEREKIVSDKKNLVMKNGIAYRFLSRDILTMDHVVVENGKNIRKDKKNLNTFSDSFSQGRHYDYLQITTEQGSYHLFFPEDDYKTVALRQEIIDGEDAIQALEREKDAVLQQSKDIQQKIKDLNEADNAAFDHAALKSYKNASVEETVGDYYGLKQAMLSAVDNNQKDAFQTVYDQMLVLVDDLGKKTAKVSDRKLLSIIEGIMQSNKVYKGLIAHAPPQNDQHFLEMLHKEFRSISTKEYSLKTQKLIQIMAREMADDIAYDKEEAGKIYDMIIRDTKSYHLSNFIPQEFIDQEWTEAHQKKLVKRLIRISGSMGLAEGSYEDDINKVFMKDVEDELTARLVYKHELFHYLADNNIIRIPAEWEQITFAVSLIEVLRYFKGQKNAEQKALDWYEKLSNDPTVRHLFHLGYEKEKNGEMTMVINPGVSDRKAGYFSIDYLKILATQVFEKVGARTEILEDEYQSQRAVGYMIAGITTAMSEKSESDDSNPYRLLREYLNLLDDRLGSKEDNPRVVEALKEIDRDIERYAQISSGSRVQLVDAEGGFWRYIQKAHGTADLRRIKTDTYPRSSDGEDKDDIDGQLKAARERGLGLTSLVIDTRIYGLHSRIERDLGENVANHPTVDTFWDQMAIFKVAESGGRQSETSLKLYGDVDKQKFSGALRRVYDILEDRYDLGDSEAAQRMAETFHRSNPLHLQLIDTMLYRRVHYDPKTKDFTDPRVANPVVEDAVARSMGSTDATDLDDNIGWINVLFHPSRITDDQWIEGMKTVWPVYEELYNIDLKTEERWRTYQRKMKEQQKQAIRDEFDKLSEKALEELDQDLEGLPDEIKNPIKEAAKRNLEQMGEEFANQAMPGGAQAGQGQQPQASGGQGRPQPGMRQSGRPGQPSGSQQDLSDPKDLKDTLDQLEGKLNQIERGMSDINENLDDIKDGIGKTNTDDVREGKKSERTENIDKLVQQTKAIQDDVNDVLNQGREAQRQGNEQNDQTNRVRQSLPSPEQANKAKEISDELKKRLDELVKKLEKLQNHANNQNRSANDLKKKDADPNSDETQMGSQIRDFEQARDALKDGVDENSGQNREVLNKLHELQKGISDLQSSQNSRNQQTPSSKQKTQKPAEKTNNKEKRQKDPSQYRKVPEKLKITNAESIKDASQTKQQKGINPSAIKARPFKFDKKNAERDRENLIRRKTGLSVEEFEEMEGWYNIELNYKEKLFTVRQMIKAMVHALDVLTFPDVDTQFQGGREDGDIVDDIVEAMLGGKQYRAQWIVKNPKRLKMTFLIDTSWSMGDNNDTNFEPIQMARILMFTWISALFEHNKKRQRKSYKPVEFELALFDDDPDPNLEKAMISHKMVARKDFRVERLLYDTWHKLIRGDGTNYSDSLGRYVTRLINSRFEANADGLKMLFAFTDEFVSDGQKAEVLGIIESAQADNTYVFTSPLGDAAQRRVTESVHHEHVYQVISPLPFETLVERTFASFQRVFKERPAQGKSWTQSTRDPKQMDEATLSKPKFSKRKPVPGAEHWKNFYVQTINNVEYLVFHRDGEEALYFPRGEGGEDVPRKIAKHLPYSEESEDLVVDFLRRMYRQDVLVPIAISDDSRFHARKIHSNLIRVKQMNTRQEEKASHEFFIYGTPTADPDLEGAYMNPQKQAVRWKKSNDQRLVISLANGDFKDVKDFNIDDAKDWMLYTVNSKQIFAFNGKTFQVRQLNFNNAQWQTEYILNIPKETKADKWDGEIANHTGDTGTGKDTTVRTAAFLMNQGVVFMGAHEEITDEKFSYGERTSDGGKENTSGMEPAPYGKAMHIGLWYAVDEQQKLAGEIFNSQKSSITGKTHQWPIIAREGEAEQLVTTPNDPLARFITTSNKIRAGIQGRSNEENAPILERMTNIDYYDKHPDKEFLGQLQQALAYAQDWEKGQDDWEAYQQKIAETVQALLKVATDLRFDFWGFTTPEQRALILEEWDLLDSDYRVLRKQENAQIREAFKQGIDPLGDNLKRRPSWRIIQNIMKHYISYEKDFKYRPIETLTHYYNFWAEFDENDDFEAVVLKFENDWRKDKKTPPLVLNADTKTFVVEGDSLRIIPQGPSQKYWDEVVVPLHPSARIRSGEVPEEVEEWLSIEENIMSFYRALQAYSKPIKRHLIAVGPPGAGKSELNEVLQALVNGPELLRIEMTEQKRVSQMTFQRDVVDGKTVYTPLTIPRAMNDGTGHGQLLNIDETSQGRPGALSFLNSLSEDGFIDDPRRDGKPYEEERGFLIHHTLNEAGQGTGVKEMPADFLERAFFIKQEVLPPDRQQEILTHLAKKTSLKTGRERRINPKLLGEPLRDEKGKDIKREGIVQYSGIIGIAQELNYRQSKDPTFLPPHRAVSLRVLIKFVKNILDNYEFLVSQKKLKPHFIFFKLFIEKFAMEGEEDQVEQWKENILEVFRERGLSTDQEDLDIINEFLEGQGVIVEDIPLIVEPQTGDEQLDRIFKFLQTNIGGSGVQMQIDRLYDWVNENLEKAKSDENEDNSEEAKKRSAERTVYTIHTLWPRLRHFYQLIDIIKKHRSANSEYAHEVAHLQSLEQLQSGLRAKVESDEIGWSVELFYTQSNETIKLYDVDYAGLASSEPAETDLDSASLTREDTEVLTGLLGRAAVMQLGLINELGANQQYVDNFIKNAEASLTGNLQEDLDNLQKARDVLIGLENEDFKGPLKRLNEKIKDLEEQIAQQPKEEEEDDWSLPSIKQRLKQKQDQLSLLTQKNTDSSQRLKYELLDTPYQDIKPEKITQYDLPENGEVVSFDVSDDARKMVFNNTWMGFEVHTRSASSSGEVQKNKSLATSGSTRRITRLSPDGIYTVSVDPELGIDIFKEDLDNPHQTISINDIDGGAVQSIFMMPDNEHFITAGFDESVQMWSLETGKEIKKKEAASAGWVRQVGVSPEGHFVVMGTDLRNVDIWDLETNEIVSIPREKINLEGDIHFIGVSYEAETIVVQNHHGLLNIFRKDRATGQYTSIMNRAGNLGGEKLLLTDDGRFLVQRQISSGSIPMTIQIVEIASFVEMVNGLSDTYDREDIYVGPIADKDYKLIENKLYMINKNGEVHEAEIFKVTEEAGGQPVTASAPTEQILKEQITLLEQMIAIHNKLAQSKTAGAAQGPAPLVLEADVIKKIEEIMTAEESYRAKPAGELLGKIKGKSWKDEDEVRDELILTIYKEVHEIQKNNTQISDGYRAGLIARYVQTLLHMYKFHPQYALQYSGNITNEPNDIKREARFIAATRLASLNVDNDYFDTLKDRLEEYMNREYTTSEPSGNPEEVRFTEEMAKMYAARGAVDEDYYRTNIVSRKNSTHSWKRMALSKAIVLLGGEKYYITARPKLEDLINTVHTEQNSDYRRYDFEILVNHFGLLGKSGEDVVKGYLRETDFLKDAAQKTLAGIYVEEDYALDKRPIKEVLSELSITIEHMMDENEALNGLHVAAKYYYDKKEDVNQLESLIEYVHIRDNIEEVQQILAEDYLRRIHRGDLTVKDLDEKIKGAKYNLQSAAMMAYSQLIDEGYFGEGIIPVSPAADQTKEFKELIQRYNELEAQPKQIQDAQVNTVYESTTQAATYRIVKNVDKVVPQLIEQIPGANFNHFDIDDDVKHRAWLHNLRLLGSTLIDFKELDKKHTVHTDVNVKSDFDKLFVRMTKNDRIILIVDPELGVIRKNYTYGELDTIVSLNDIDGDKIESLALFPDNELFVTAASGKYVEIWDTRTGKKIGQHITLKNLIRRQTSPVLARSVAVSPDGNIVVIGTNKRTIQIWNRQTDTNKLIDVGRSAKKNTVQVEVSYGGNTVLARDKDGYIMVFQWNQKDEEYMRIFSDSPFANKDKVQMTPDGRYIFGLNGSKVDFVDLQQSDGNKAPKMLIDSKVELTDLKLIGDSLFTTDVDGNILRWKVLDKVVTSEIKLLPLSSVITVAFNFDHFPTFANRLDEFEERVTSKNGQFDAQIIYIAGTPHIRVFDKEDDSGHVLGMFTKNPKGLLWSEDGELLGMIFSDGSQQVLRVAESIIDAASLAGKDIKALTGLLGSEAVMQLGLINELGANKDYVNNFIQNVEASLTGNLQEDFDNLQKARNVLIGLENEGFKGPINHLHEKIKSIEEAIAQQPKEVLKPDEKDTKDITDTPKVIEKLATQNKTSIESIREFSFDKPVTAVAWFPGGEKILVGGKDGIARVIHGNMGLQSTEFNHSEPITAVAVNADGSQIATAGGQFHEIRIWRTNDNTKPFKFGGHKGLVNFMEFNDSNNVIAVSPYPSRGDFMIVILPHGVASIGSSGAYLDGMTAIDMELENSKKIILENEMTSEKFDFQFDQDVIAARFINKKFIAVLLKDSNVVTIYNSETKQAIEEIKHEGIIESLSVDRENRNLMIGGRVKPDKWLASVLNKQKGFVELWDISGLVNFDEEVTRALKSDSISNQDLLDLYHQLDAEALRFHKISLQDSIENRENEEKADHLLDQRNDIGKKLTARGVPSKELLIKDAASLEGKDIEVLAGLLGSEAVIQLGLINELGANKDYVNNFIQNAEASLTGNLKEDLDNLQKAKDVLIGLKNKDFEGPIDRLNEKIKSIEEAIAQQPKEKEDDWSLSSIKQRLKQKQAQLNKENTLQLLTHDKKKYTLRPEIKATTDDWIKTNFYEENNADATAIDNISVSAQGEAVLMAGEYAMTGYNTRTGRSNNTNTSFVFPGFNTSTGDHIYFPDVIAEVLDGGRHALISARGYDVLEIRKARKGERKFRQNKTVDIKGGVNDVKKMPDDKHFIVAGGDGSVRMYDLEGNVVEEIYSDVSEPVKRIGISETGEFIAGVTNTGQVIAKDINTGEVVGLMYIDDVMGPVAAKSVAISPDGRQVIVVGQNLNSSGYNIHTFKDQQKIPLTHILPEQDEQGIELNHHVNFEKVKFVGNDYLLTLAEGRLHLWDTSQKKKLSGLKNYKNISDFDVFNGQVFMGKSDGRLSVWDVWDVEQDAGLPKTAASNGQEPILKEQITILERAKAIQEKSSQTVISTQGDKDVNNIIFYNMRVEKIKKIIESTDSLETASAASLLGKIQVKQGLADDTLVLELLSNKISDSLNRSERQRAIEQIIPVLVDVLRKRGGDLTQAVDDLVDDTYVPRRQMGFRVLVQLALQTTDHDELDKFQNKLEGLFTDKYANEDSHLVMSDEDIAETADYLGEFYAYRAESDPKFYKKLADMLYGRQVEPPLWQKIAVAKAIVILGYDEYTLHSGHTHTLDEFQKFYAGESNNALRQHYENIFVNAVAGEYDGRPDQLFKLLRSHQYPKYPTQRALSYLYAKKDFSNDQRTFTQVMDDLGINVHAKNNIWEEENRFRVNIKYFEDKQEDLSRSEVALSMHSLDETPESMMRILAEYYVKLINEKRLMIDDLIEKADKSVKVGVKEAAIIALDMLIDEGYFDTLKSSVFLDMDFLEEKEYRQDGTIKSAFHEASQAAGELLSRMQVMGGMNFDGLKEIVEYIVEHHESITPMMGKNEYYYGTEEQAIKLLVGMYKQEPVKTLEYIDEILQKIQLETQGIAIMALAEIGKIEVADKGMYESIVKKIEEYFDNYRRPMGDPTEDYKELWSRLAEYLGELYVVRIAISPDDHKDVFRFRITENNFGKYIASAKASVLLGAEKYRNGIGHSQGTLEGLFESEGNPYYKSYEEKILINYYTKYLSRAKIKSILKEEDYRQNAARTALARIYAQRNYSQEQKSIDDILTELSIDLKDNMNGEEETAFNAFSIAAKYYFDKNLDVSEFEKFVNNVFLTNWMDNGERIRRILEQDYVRRFKTGNLTAAQLIERIERSEYGSFKDLTHYRIKAGAIGAYKLLLEEGYFGEGAVQAPTAVDQEKALEELIQRYNALEEQLRNIPQVEVGTQTSLLDDYKRLHRRRINSSNNIDSAAINTGGIDLKSLQDSLKIRNNGQGVDFGTLPAAVPANFEGLFPVIINIQPAAPPLFLSQLKEYEPEIQLSAAGL